MRRTRQRGSAAVETALVAIPMICMFLGTVELGRCMWMYHTLSSATKAAARYAIVHGESCVAAGCGSSVATVAGVLRRSGIGLDARNVSLSFTAGTASVECVLPTCEARSDAWPPASHNTAGKKITIRASYNFVSVITGFWPGQRGGTVQLIAQSTEAMQF
ncbi:MAG: TadE family protein [Bryobacteraceae bacterium]